MAQVNLSERMARVEAKLESIESHLQSLASDLGELRGRLEDRVTSLERWQASRQALNHASEVSRSQALAVLLAVLFGSGGLVTSLVTVLSR